jgi:hypothetical protein
MNKEEIKSLFEKVIDAYVSAEDYGLTSYVHDSEEEQEAEDEQYQYEFSRIMTKTEEWRRELERLLNGKA